jgi:hypothetical protein
VLPATNPDDQWTLPEIDVPDAIDHLLGLQGTFNGIVFGLCLKIFWFCAKFQLKHVFAAFNYMQ